MDAKSLISLVLLVGAVGGFYVYGKSQEAAEANQPLLSSQAAPFSNDPVVLSDGDEVEAWRMAPSSAQMAKLVEEMAPVQVDRFFASNWNAVRTTSASGAEEQVADFSAEFSRRDEGGRWKIAARLRWANPGWEPIESNLEI